MADDTEDSPYDLTDSAATAADTYHRAGYPDAAIAGILAGQNYESAGFNPAAVNPSSKAFGRSQWLGSRKTDVMQMASATGKDPTDPTLQDRFTLAELNGTASQGVYKPVGDALRGETDASMAGANYIHSFERPGAPAEQTEIPAVQRTAQQILPAIQRRYAQAADPQTTAKARAFLQDDATPPSPGGQFDHVSVPGTQTAPQQNHLLDSANRFLADEAPGGQAPGQAPTTPTPAKVADAMTTSVSKDPTTFGNIGHAISLIPGQLLAGAAWLPTHLIDGWNAIQHYYGEHPDAAAQALGLPPGASGLPETTIDPNTQGVAKNPHAQDELNALKHVPGLGALATGNVPGGSSDFQNFAAGHDIETRSPVEYGDTNAFDELVAGGANFVGAAFQPGGLARGAARVATSPTVGEAGKSLLSLLWRHVAEPALLEPGAMLGGDIAGRMTDNPEAQMAAQAGAIPLALGGRAAMLYGLEKAGAAGLATFSKAAAGVKGEELNRVALDKAFLSAAGGGPSSTADELAQAQARADQMKAEASNQIGNPQLGPSGQAGLPEGTSAPPAMLTSSAPLQKMTWNILHRGDEIQNHFVSQDQPRNTLAMNALRPQGDAQDAVQAVQNHQTAAQTAISMRIAQAQQDAEQTVRGLSRSSTGQLLHEGDVNAEDALARESVKELQSARDDARTMVDDGYDVARAQGQLDATHTTPQLYNALEGVIQTARQRGNLAKDIPLGEVSSLYKDGNPGAMWNGQGVRDPQTMGTQFHAGPNAAYPQDMTIDRALSLESNLGNSLRQEQDKLTAADGSGSRIRLSNLAAMKAAVGDWIEQATLLNGNYASLRNARNQAALFHNNFESGIIGDVLNGSSLVNPARALNSYLGKSLYASQAADEFQRALQYRTGATAARDAAFPGTFDPAAPGMGSQLPGVGGNPGLPPVQQSKNVIADYLHQSYLNSRVAGGRNQGEAWLLNRRPFFEKLQGDPTFNQLHQTLMEYQNQMDHELPKVRAYDAADLDRVQNSAAQEFLGGEAGPRLDAVLNGKTPASGMRDLLGIVRGSPNAYRGFQAMLWDRAVTAGTLQSPTTLGSTLSGQAMQQWLSKPGVKAAYDVARADDPAWAQRFDKLVNGAALQDRLNVAPNVSLPPEAQTATGGGPAMDLAQALTKILVTQTLGHKLNVGGGIQVPAIVSSLTGKWFPQIASSVAKLTGRIDPVTASRMAMRQTLQDPEKLRALLAPRAGGPSQTKWSAGLEPWLQSLGIEVGQSLLTPAQPTPNLGEGKVTP